MTPEQRAALAARVAQPDLAGLSEWRVAQALNAPGSGANSAWQDVPTAAVYRRLLVDAAPGAGAGAVSAWGLIEINSRRAAATTWASAASTPNAQDQVVAHLTTLVRWVQSFPAIEASDASVRARMAAVFAALVTAGFVGDATRNAIVALAQRPSSWAEDSGFVGGVTPRQVGDVRGAAL